MLIGINQIGFLESGESQYFDNIEVKDQYAIFETNTIPAFVLISDTSASTGTVQVFDCNDSAVGAAQSITITSNNSAKQLKYTGGTLTSSDDGYYYLKIVCGSDIYRSEYFVWKTTVSDLLKIQATPSNLVLYNLYTPYTIDNSSIVYTGHYNVASSLTKVDELESETGEEGNDRPFGEIPLSNFTSFKHEIQLRCLESGYKFLGAFRTFEVNGTVQLTYKSKIWTGFNFELEVNENTNFGDLIDCTLGFKESFYLSNSNE